MAARAARTAAGRAGRRLSQHVSENGRSFGSALFRKALGDAGYVDGQNVAIEFRSSDGQTSLLQSVADKLVAERVAVIVASQFVAGFAAKNATATISIVFTVGSSPAALEQVRSMIRPDGNVTAVSQMLPAIAPKRLEIIRQLMPDAKTVAFLDNPVGQAYPAEFRFQLPCLRPPRRSGFESRCYRPGTTTKWRNCLERGPVSKATGLS